MNTGSRPFKPTPVEKPAGRGVSEKVQPDGKDDRSDGRQSSPAGQPTNLGNWKYVPPEENGPTVKPAHCPSAAILLANVENRV